MSNCICCFRLKKLIKCDGCGNFTCLKCCYRGNCELGCNYNCDDSDEFNYCKKCTLDEKSPHLVHGNYDIEHQNYFPDYIKDDHEYRTENKKKCKKLLLLSRNDINCPFYKEIFPLDLFKIIFEF